MARVASRTAPIILASLLAALGAIPSAVSAQDDAAPSMCLLTLDEVADLTGLAFATATEARGGCTYASDPTIDLYAVDLRTDSDTSLDGIRFQYSAGGGDETIGGFPAWVSDDGIFLDVGERLFVIQPVFFMSDATPDPATVQLPIAELVATRLGPALEAAFGSGDRLMSQFPTQIGDQQLFVDLMPGREFLAFVDLGTAAIEEVLSSQGLSLDDVTVGIASLMDGGDVMALQVPGLDAALLLPPVRDRYVALGGQAATEMRAGKEVTAIAEQRTWFYVSGDTLWIVGRTDDATVDAILEALP